MTWNINWFRGQKEAELAKKAITERATIANDYLKLTKKEHFDLISLCIRNKYENIFLIGLEFFKHKNNFDIPFFYKTKKELINHFKKTPITSKHILIKGSRGMEMEDLINYI